MSGPTEGGSLRLVATLTFAGLLSGLVLVGAYETTLPRIEANQAAALRRAVFQVVPGATSMRPMAWTGDALAPAEGGGAGDGLVFAAYDDAGNFAGWAIPGEGSGFQDTISLIFGWDPARKRVVGMRVLESRETPGLGDKILKDAAFLGEFDDLAVEPAVEVVKKGAGTKPNQLDGITGATISSKAVAKIVTTTGHRWMDRLPEPGTEPAAAARPAPAEGS